VGWLVNHEFCGTQSGTGAGLLRVLRFPLSIIIPPTAPYVSSSLIRGWYNRPNMNVKRCGKEQLWPKLRYYSSIYLEVLRKINNKHRMSVCGPEFETGAVPIRNMKTNHSTATFGTCSLLILRSICFFFCYLLLFLHRHRRPYELQKLDQKQLSDVNDVRKNTRAWEACKFYFYSLTHCSLLKLACLRGICFNWLILYATRLSQLNRLYSM
jgi:hypothetical protein